MRTYRIAVALAVLGAASLAAQTERDPRGTAQAEPDSKDGAAARKERLTNALRKMSQLPAVAYRSKETGTSGMDIRIGGAKPAPTEVTGKQADGLLHATCHGDQELLLGGRRMLARGDGEAWRVRAGKTANGLPLPYVFDPQSFFDIVRGMDLTVANAEVGSWQDKPIEVFSVTLTGDAARDLMWGGLVPEPSGFGSTVVMRVAGAVGGAAPPPPQPKLTVDLAFFVDPASDLVQRVRVRVTDANEGAVFGGRVVFAAGGGIQVGGDDEEEEEEEADETEDAKPAKVIYKDGLPVHKKKRKGAGEATATLDVEFSDFEKATLPELDETARQLLGRPAAK